jgi:hypothetical protein
MSEAETTELTPVKETEVVRGLRGEVGLASAGLTMRQRWASANTGLSLKRFARQLVKDGDAVAKEWFANKRGAKDEKRTDKNMQRVIAERTATKASKRKTGKK